MFRLTAVAGVVLVAGCNHAGGSTMADDGRSGVPPRTTTDAGVPYELVEASVVLNPNGTTPLAALLSVSTPVATRATIHVSGPEGWHAVFDKLATTHRLPVVGFRPGEHYELRVELRADSGRVFSADSSLSVDTAALPGEFPGVQLVNSIPERMQPGYTLFSARINGNYLAIVNERGQVVWYYDGSDTALDVRQLPDGRLLLLEGGSVVVMDLLGNVSLRLSPEPADNDYHHEVSPNASGTFWTLGNRTTIVDDFSTNYDDLTQLERVEITDDTLIQIDPARGVLQRLFLRDVLDPKRIAYDSLNTHSELGTPRDWAHSNAIIEADQGQAVLVSSRHQDAVTKLRGDSGAIVWILANHDNWGEGFSRYLLTPIGDDFRWNYHQHAPQLTPQGTLLLFDNGNRQASPSDGRVPVPTSEAESRIVEYRINEADMTVEQVWEYRHPVERWFSPVVGDSDLQPDTNNVLATFGVLQSVANPERSMQARIVEIDRDRGNELVFELEIFSAQSQGSTGFVYRAERIPPIR